MTARIVSILSDNEIIFGFNLLFEFNFIPLLKSHKNVGDRCDPPFPHTNIFYFFNLIKYYFPNFCNLITSKSLIPFLSVPK